MKWYNCSSDERLKDFPLVIKVVKQWFKYLSRDFYEDLINEGALFLIKWIDEHGHLTKDTQKNFSKNLCRHLAKAYYRIFLKWKQRNFAQLPKNDLLRENVYHNPEPSTFKQILDIDLIELKDYLTIREYEVLILTYKGYKQYEIASIIGTAKSNISSIWQRVCSILHSIKRHKDNKDGIDLRLKHKCKNLIRKQQVHPSLLEIT